MSGASGERVGRCIVWVAVLPTSTTSLTVVLDHDESIRAGRFRHVADRDRFVVGAALLRLAVADRHRCDPTDVRVDRTCPDCGRLHGRPSVASQPGLAPIDVSVSHAGQLVLVALTDSGRVGVDVEPVTERHEELVGAACAPIERPAIRSAQDFAIVWVRKEAVLKAVGSGLRRSPGDVIVSGPAEPAELVTVDGVRPGRCHLFDLALPHVVEPSHVAAVAVIGDRPVAVETRRADRLLKI